MDLLWYASIAASVVLVYVLTSFAPYLWRKRGERAILQRNFPAPAAAHWLLGHVPLLSGLSYETLMLFSRWTKSYPRYYLFHAGPFDTKLVLNHAETIKQLTKTYEPKQLGFGGVYSFNLPFFGEGLVLSSGAKWHRNRKLLTPAFHFDVLKGYGHIFNEGALKFVSKLDELSAKTGESVEISDHLRMCTLEIVMRAAFSSGTDVQGHGDSCKYANATDFLSQQVIKRAITPLHHFDWLYKRTQEGKTFYENVKYVNNVAATVIDQRRSELAQSEVGDNKDSCKNNRKHLDFLDRLLLARDEDGNGLSRDDLLNEVKTFMFAGHDTTKSGIMWLIYNLAKYPDYQAKAR